MSKEAKFSGIVGTSYCGSTMLSYMLGSSSDVFSTGELTHENDRLRCGNWHPGEKCPIWDEKLKDKLIKNKKKRNRILKRKAASRLNAKIVLNPDKRPYLYERAYNWGDDVDFLIFLYKNPLAFAYSFMTHQRNKLGKKFDERNRDYGLIRLACKTYYDTYYNGLAFANKCNIPYIVVSYEDLATSPHSIIKNICQVLDVEYYDGMIEYWNNADKLHMVPAGNAGAKHQFFEKQKYKDRWNDRVEGNHKSYFKEHSEWFLNNYRKITLDEKWKKHLKGKYKKYIKKNQNCSAIYNKLNSIRITKRSTKHIKIIKGGKIVYNI